MIIVVFICSLVIIGILLRLLQKTSKELEGTIKHNRELSNQVRLKQAYIDKLKRELKRKERGR